MLIISYIILILLLLLFSITILNLFTQKNFNKLNSEVIKGSQPFISVMIPARNEEKNVTKCIESILNQSYKNFELIVLDDNSIDKTFELVNQIKDEKLKVVKGKPLPEGWVGKSFACQQLFEISEGELLLFLDADTFLKPDSLEKIVKFVCKYKPDLLSLMPEEIALSFWEKITIPLLHFTVYTMLPMPAVEKTSKLSLTMSNGQFMLFKRESYIKIGGHESVRNKMVDDVWLGRAIKSNGGKIIFADGTDICECRMYENFKEIFIGFTKNIFPGLSLSTFNIFFVITLFSFLFIFPYILFFIGFFSNDINLMSLSLINIFIPIIIRIIHSLKYKQSVIFSFLNLISMLFFIVLCFSSFYVFKIGKGANWKDRFYDFKTVSD
ncbi:MAG: glycosyltransferase [Ignavibacteria bacterium]|nr:glycosyltransferase [Ignavibacteria bacterium]